MIKTGYGTADITPPVGAEMMGYYYKRYAKGAHDPLCAKALFLDDGKTEAALLAFDVSTLNESSYTPIAEVVAESGIVPLEHTLICAIQTHTGPVITPEHARWMGERMVGALAQAKADLREAKLLTGTASIAGLAFNRRYFMKDGGVVTNPGKCNPDVVKPAGSAPESMRFVAIDRSAGGNLLLSNVALHPDTVAGDYFSADYPFFIEQEVREHLAGTTGVVYTNGACGDINHWDVHNPSPQRGFDEAERIGRSIGANLLAAMNDADPVAGDVVRAGKEKIVVPYAGTTAQQLEWAREVLSRPYPEGVDFTMDVVEATKIQRISQMSGDAGELEISAISVGDMAFVGVPAELFNETADRIEQASPFRVTVVICLAGSHIGYIPYERAFAEGGYEVASCVFASDAAARVEMGVKRLLAQLAA